MLARAIGRDGAGGAVRCDPSRARADRCVCFHISDRQQTSRAELGSTDYIGAVGETVGIAPGPIVYPKVPGCRLLCFVCFKKELRRNQMWFFVAPSF